MFEYQISLLSEERAVRLLADHAVECAAAYVDHQRGVWERNSLVRGAVFGAVFGHTETVSTAAVDEPGSDGQRRGGSRRVSVIVGHSELKWDIGDVLKRPGLRRDCLQYAAGTAAAASTTTSESSVTQCPWSFHVSAACDAAVYGYRGALLDWDYFASAYAPVADDDGWFNEPAPHHSASEDFHRLYRPHRCLVGTELMQAYCAAASAVDRHAPTLAEFVQSRLDQWSRDVVEPVYRPLKALSLGRLRRADFAGSDLTRVSLAGVDLRLTGLRDCLLVHGRLTATRLGELGAACDGLDVSYASLVDADLDVDLLACASVTARYAVVGYRSTTGADAESPGDDELCVDHDDDDSRQLLVSTEQGHVMPVADSE